MSERPSRRPEDIRETRIKRVLHYIREECGGNTTVSDVVKFALKTFGFGLKPATVYSYLETLLFMGEITINNGHIKIVKKEEKK